MSAVKAESRSTTAPGVIRADECYTVPEFVARTGLGKQARRELSARGGLKSHRVGNRRFILGSDFIAWLQRQES